MVPPVRLNIFWNRTVHLDNQMSRRDCQIWQIVALGHEAIRLFLRN